MTGRDRQRYNLKARDCLLPPLLLSLLRARSLSLRVYQADDGEVRDQQFTVLHFRFFPPTSRSADSILQVEPAPSGRLKPAPTKKQGGVNQSSVVGAVAPKLRRSEGGRLGRKD